jgi:carbamoyl-phosphate synthase large subunit
MNADPIRILIPGAGGPGTINLCRSLRRAPEPVYLVGTDCDRAFGCLALTDELHHIVRASEEEEYINSISALCDQRSVDLILPNNSIEARALARHREDLGAQLLLPSGRTLDLANSKWRSYLRWREDGVPVPETRLLAGPEDVDAAFQSIQTRPIWVRGAGIPGKGIGVASLPCQTPDQAKEWVNYWNGWSGMIASSYLPGANLTWIGLFRDGKLITGQTRQRDRYILPHVSPSGITGAPAISHTVHREDVFDTALKACSALDPMLNGVVFLDFKEDAAGLPHVTEMNAGRFGTTHFFYTAAGLNLPWILVQLALGRPIPSVSQRNPLPPDLYWIRTLDAGPVLITGDDLRSGATNKGQRFGLHGAPADAPPETGLGFSPDRD